jgi:hypothetical protein
VAWLGEQLQDFGAALIRAWFLTPFSAHIYHLRLGNIYMTPAYSIRELTEEKFTPLFDKCKASVFEDVHSYDLRDILSATELEHIKKLGQGLGNQYKLHLGVFDKDNKFVGWTWGSQESASTFYMVNSGILTRISQMKPAGLACDLRQNPEKQGYFAHSCHADRKTRWVTAKTGSCGSISMAV